MAWAASVDRCPCCRSEGPISDSALDAEIEDLDRQLTRLVTATAPALIARPGIGIHTAATLLVAAGGDPDRQHSEAA